MNQSIDQYLSWFEHERRCAANTLSATRRDLALMIQLLGQAPASSQTLRLALGTLKSKSLAPRTLARIASSWRGYFKWLATRGEIEQDPMTGIRTPKQARLLPKALSPDAVGLLLQHTQLQSKPAQTPGAATQLTDTETLGRLVQLTQFQTVALAELLYGAGLRLSEALSLDVQYHVTALGWVDWQEKEVRVMGKGSKVRVVPLGQLAHEALLQWRSLRVGLQRTSDQMALFLGARGARLSARVAQLNLAKLAQRQGLDQHVHPHMLRHSYASHVLQSSGDLRAVQELLGHASIASTQIYTSLDFQHLAAVYDQAHPRAKKP